MISRRELFRRALGLPLVAGLAAVVTRKPKRMHEFTSCVVTDVRWHGGTILHGDAVSMKNYRDAIVCYRGRIDTLDTYRGRPFVYANADFDQVCAWHGIKPDVALKSILETFPNL